MVNSGTLNFARVESNGVVIWQGDPNCDAAHARLLTWLNNLVAGQFLQSADPSDNILKGNLGEAIAFFIGRSYDFSGPAFTTYGANINPFSGVSKAEIDIVWFHRGAMPADDVVILQEVKTTGHVNLGYADRLVADYDKLFGTDLRLTLNTRLQSIKNRLRYYDKRPDLADRFTALGGQSPQTSPRVRLLPTLLHDLVASDPVGKMIAIRTTIVGRGWSPSAVWPWTIRLSDLNGRLLRLAEGRT